MKKEIIKKILKQNKQELKNCLIDMYNIDINNIDIKDILDDLNIRQLKELLEYIKE